MREGEESPAALMVGGVPCCQAVEAACRGWKAIGSGHAKTCYILHVVMHTAVSRTHADTY
jgi:hypothetical protein